MAGRVAVTKECNMVAIKYEISTCYGQISTLSIQLHLCVGRLETLDFDSWNEMRESVDWIKYKLKWIDTMKSQWTV